MEAVMELSGNIRGLVGVGGIAIDDGWIDTGTIGFFSVVRFSTKFRHCSPY